jgi:hypothetical protein
MERVAFLIEDTGERIGCLLNPESLVVRRTAGVQPRRSAGGALTGTGLPDDPLLFTGGGRTELELDLLFDVGLAGSSLQTGDVRDLTGPLARLAENAAGRDGYGQLPLARFLWGKAWNIPGVVTALAERFERFTPEGVPERSWMRMRFLRVSEPATPAPPSRPADEGPVAFPEEPAVGGGAPAGLDIPEELMQVHETLGGGQGGGDRQSGERLDELAARYYGDPALWRIIAAFNNIDDPANIAPGQVLRIPPLSAVEGQS